MHGLADLLHAAEGEGEVREAAADVREREELAELTGGLDELHGVGVVLGDTGGDRQNVLFVK